MILNGKTIFYRRHFLETKKYKLTLFQIRLDFYIYHTIEASLSLSKKFTLFFTLFDIIKLHIARTTESDHAGWYLEFIFLGICINYEYSDTRHWDYDKGCFKDENEI